MKLLLCLAAILVCASALPSLTHTKDVDLTDMLRISPNAHNFARQMKYIADNFETTTPRKQIQDINDFVDMVIAESRNFLVNYGFDPMNLPDLDENFDIAGTPINLRLNDGVVHNASSIYRYLDVGLDYENRILTIDTPVMFNSFDMIYNYDIEVGNDTTLLKGKLNGKVDLVNIKFIVQLDFRNLQITLKSFELTNMGVLKVDFVGGMLDWLIDVITDYVTNELRDEIIWVVEAVCSFTLKNIFDIINKVLESITP